MRWILPAAIRDVPPAPPALGRDVALSGGSFVITPAGDYATVEGASALRQGLEHRLVTDPSEYPHEPDFGAGLGAELKRGVSTATLARIRARALAQCRADDRVRDVPVASISRIAGTSGTRLEIAVSTGAEQVILRPIEVNP